MAAILADMMLVFSSGKLEGSPLQQACFEPSDDALQAFWRQCEDAMRRGMEVGRAGWMAGWLAGWGMHHENRQGVMVAWLGGESL